VPVAFISDIHLGKTRGPEDRSRESDLVAFLRVSESDLSALYLVGDVFDAYIEYRSVVPKGAFRLLAQLDRMVEQSIPVTYVLGNHDPWHLDYFESIGVEVVPDHVIRRHHGRSVLIAHGDQAAPKWSPYGLILRLLRNPLPVWLYRNLMPADLGYALARGIKKLVSSDEPSPKNVEQLRAFAASLLAQPAIDAVVLGHSHQAEIRTNRDGTYVNAGEWDRRRQAALLDENGFRLVTWAPAVGETVLAHEESLSAPIV